MQAKEMIGQVSVDTRQASVSFNEYLRLVSCQRRADPDETSLLSVFQWVLGLMLTLGSL